MKTGKPYRKYKPGTVCEKCGKVHEETTWGGARRCQAHTRDGKQCKARAMKARQVCRLHGGKLGGAPIKHGRYSRHLPNRLLERYELARTDKELLALKEEIALIDALTQEHLARLDVAVDFEAFGAGLKKLKAAVKAADMDALASAVAGLEEAASRLAGYQKTVETVQNLVESRRKLVETESKRLRDADLVITAEQVMVLVAAITDVITRHVREQAALRAIADELGGILNYGKPAALIEAEGKEVEG